MYEKQKKELAELCHRLYERGLAAACDGNVSMRVSETHILLTPSGRNKGLVRAEEMLVLDLAGNPVEGTGRASKEYPMHRVIYGGRADVNAVVHTHPVYATAFALAGKNIPENCLIETRMVLKSVRLAGYATPGTAELAEAVRPCLPGCGAILLKNHGAVTLGKDPEDAFNKMEALESVAKTVLLSRILGEPEVISEENMKKMESVRAARTVPGKEEGTP